MPYDKKSIHYVPKGKLGFAVHQIPVYAMNGWVKDRLGALEATPTPGRYNIIPSIDGRFLLPKVHIPHGDPVLILSEPSKITDATEYYYHVLWKEIDCWIHFDHIVNPHFRT